jgi:NADPH-dependent curcumin reductase CurA
MRAEGTKSYVPPYPLGKPITNFGVSEVLKSENSKFAVGAKVYGSHEFCEYQVFGEDVVGGLIVLENKEKLPWTVSVFRAFELEKVGLTFLGLQTWVGACGMPGQTAWYGLHDIGKPQKGETIFVSGAAGAVGQCVVCLFFPH